MRKTAMLALKKADHRALPLPQAIVAELHLEAGDRLEVVQVESGSDDLRRAEALKALKALSRPLPDNFRFDRDEANQR